LIWIENEHQEAAIAEPLLIDKLKAKQRKFVSCYMQSLNATQAAKDAGYSPKTAYSIGFDLLRKPEIKEAVAQLMQRDSMHPQEIVYRLTRQAMGDITDVLDPVTMTLDIKKAKELGSTHLIRKFKQITITHDEEEQLILEIELHDAQKALYYLGKIHALFTDKLKIETWQDEAIAAIKNGEIAFEPLALQLGDDLANQLFAQAGLVVPGSISASQSGDA
jgi:phage terminase small subunit